MFSYVKAAAFHPQSLRASPEGHAVTPAVVPGVPAAAMFFEHLADADAAALQRLVYITLSSCDDGVFSYVKATAFHPRSLRAGPEGILRLGSDFDNRRETIKTNYYVLQFLVSPVLQGEGDILPDSLLEAFLWSSFHDAWP